jgi:hypothetical protein
MRDLNDLVPPELNLRISLATAINSSGQIVANGQDGQGNAVAFLLTPVPGRTGDANCDDRVDIDDLLLVINAWGTSQSAADLDESGIVDLSDLMMVLEGWSF